MQKWNVRVCCLLALVTLVGAASGPAFAAHKPPPVAHHGWGSH
jgi:hypothetical protein